MNLLFFSSNIKRPTNSKFLESHLVPYYTKNEISRNKIFILPFILGAYDGSHIDFNKECK